MSVYCYFEIFVILLLNENSICASQTHNLQSDLIQIQLFRIRSILNVPVHLISIRSSFTLQVQCKQSERVKKIWSVRHEREKNDSFWQKRTIKRDLVWNCIENKMLRQTFGIQLLIFSLILSVKSSDSKSYRCNGKHKSVKKKSKCRHTKPSLTSSKTFKSIVFLPSLFVQLKDVITNDFK